MQKMLSTLKARISAGERQRKGSQYEADIKEGQAFLAANAKAEGVVSLSNGLQYKVVREGSGRTPGSFDNVSIRYTGMLIGGSEFYTTRNAPEPQNIMVGNFIPGMRELVQRMKEGARWQMFIPAEMGYASGNPLYGKTLIFDVELIRIHPTK
jgi:FKBP-type peptidyl-prolyl cis-trans isomerase FklB